MYSALVYNSKISIIIPAFNEELVIANFLSKCIELKSSFNNIEIIVVNDGSTDKTKELVQEISKNNPNILLLNFVKNSGHMAALDAGIKAATGDWVVTIDADGQDDPKLIITMYEKCINSNAEICYTKRRNRKNDPIIYKLFSPIFYKLIMAATKGSEIYQSADFRLISRRVVNTLLSLPESDKVYRILIPQLGYSFVVLEYERNSRIGGVSKYNFKSLFTLALKSIFATTGAPLRWMSLISLFCSGVALILTGYSLFEGIFFHTVPGWSSLAFLISIFFLFQSISTLIIVEFILILLKDVRQRPTYQLTMEEVEK